MCSVVCSDKQPRTVQSHVVLLSRCPVCIKVVSAVHYCCLQVLKEVVVNLRHSGGACTGRGPARRCAHGHVVGLQGVDTHGRHACRAGPDQPSRPDDVPGDLVIAKHHRLTVPDRQGAGMAVQDGCEAGPLASECKG